MRMGAGFLWGRRNVLRLTVVMATQLCEETKPLRCTPYRGDCFVCELHPGKAAIKWRPFCLEPWGAGNKSRACHRDTTPAFVRPLGGSREGVTPGRDPKHPSPPCKGQWLLFHSQQGGNPGGAAT